MENSLPKFLNAIISLRNSKIAILGIGNELNGDDAAGVLVARDLARLMLDDELQHNSSSSNVLIYEAGPAPEAFTGPLRRFAPELIMLIDAAELGQSPGTVQCFDWPAAQGLSASTHTLPPSMLARFLVDELGCGVVLIGIQPKQLMFDGGVSPEIEAAVKTIVRELQQFFQNANQF